LKEKLMFMASLMMFLTQSSATAQEWWAPSQVRLFARVMVTMKMLTATKVDLVFLAGASS
jgi:hypothetical protein